MAEKAKLEIELDDKKVKAGMGKLSKDLTAVNTKAAAAGSKAAAEGAASARPQAASKEAENAFKGVSALLISQMISQTLPAIGSLFDPLRSQRQKEETLLKTALITSASLGGAAIGVAIPNVGAIGGFAAGNLVGTTAAGLVDAIDPEGRFVDRQVSQALQQEAATRARLGIDQDPDELRRIGQVARRAAETEFQAISQAQSIADEVSTNFVNRLKEGLAKAFSGQNGIDATVSSAVKGIATQALGLSSRSVGDR